jgi:hypothetical protein
LISSFVYLATATTPNDNFGGQCNCFVLSSNAVHTFPIRTASTTPKNDCN